MGLAGIEIIVGVENAFQISIPDTVVAKILTPTAPCTMSDASRQTLATRGSSNRQRFS
jgi:acyl carrier protein